MKYQINFIILCFIITIVPSFIMTIIPSSAQTSLSLVQNNTGNITVKPTPTHTSFAECKEKSLNSIDRMINSFASIHSIEQQYNPLLTKDAKKTFAEFKSMLNRAVTSHKTLLDNIELHFDAMQTATTNDTIKDILTQTKIELFADLKQDSLATIVSMKHGLHAVNTLENTYKTLLTTDVKKKLQDFKAVLNETILAHTALLNGIQQHIYHAYQPYE